MDNLRHETPVKIHAIQENQQEFEKKCEPSQATKIFSRLYLKATKLFEPTRSHVTWSCEGNELASVCLQMNTPPPIFEKYLCKQDKKMGGLQVDLINFVAI